MFCLASSSWEWQPNRIVAGNVVLGKLPSGDETDNSGNPTECGERVHPRLFLSLHNKSTLPEVWRAGDRDGAHGSVH